MTKSNFDFMFIIIKIEIKLVQREWISQLVLARTFGDFCFNNYFTSQIRFLNNKNNENKNNNNISSNNINFVAYYSRTY